MIRSFAVFTAVMFAAGAAACAEDYTVTVQTPVVVEAGATTHWMQVRPASIPTGDADKPPLVVITMQRQNNTGTHMYHGLADLISDDLGVTWRGPTERPTLQPHVHDNGLVETPVDVTPKWHAASGKLLATGATFWLDRKQGRDLPGGASAVSYAVYDPATGAWSQWDTLALPDNPLFNHYARSGSGQRVDLPGGDVLLPIYYGKHNNSIHYATVVRCRFNGEKLTYVEHGSELVIDHGRGFSEPSLAKLGDRYFLTLRNDKAGYVTAGDDGLHFDEPILWRFYDGEELGSYNTQQHWATHNGKLYLVYTRRGLDNDDIFRHRAPLVMAEVDPEKLCVIRETERVVMPKVGNARFGNFGVSAITPTETWITAGRSGAKPGEASVYISRIGWAK
ncbi:exo-alpha-sialidase [Planctomycetales bacterium ZRK34]|nr:exo-alpha-sialidase [Planctomycetales bacterium ZRK34]